MDDGTWVRADVEIDEKPVYIPNVKVESQHKDSKGGKVLSVDCEQLQVYLPLQMSKPKGIQKARRGKPFCPGQGLVRVPVTKCVKVISDEEEGDAKVTIDMSTSYEEWMVAQGLIDLQKSDENEKSKKEKSPVCKMDEKETVAKEEDSAKLCDDIFS